MLETRVVFSKKFKNIQNFTRNLFDFLPQGHETQTFSEKTTFFKDFKIGGGYLDIRVNPQTKKFLAKFDQILLCAFMVLSVGEKMRYEDVRNGVGKFRIFTFPRGVFDLDQTDVNG